MISLSPVIELLKTKPADFDGAWFRQVSNAAQYAKDIVHASSLPKPLAWVVRSSDDLTMEAYDFERSAVSFDVVFAVENLRTYDINNTDNNLLRYRVAVKSLLFGSNFFLERRVQGVVVDYTDYGIFWRDRYTLKNDII